MLRYFFTIIIALWAMSVSANVVITGTRVIYPSNQKTVSVQLTNAGKKPSLVQAWIDNGDPKAAPETIKTPFVITPPISRIDGNKGQTLRITYTGASLPNDRESIFYLNVLDIPPKPKDQSQNYLQIALRSRIKLFFRPVELTISPSDAYSQVKWRGQGKQLLVDNPTPYYITYPEVKVGAAETVSANMIAPFSQATFQLNKAIPASATTVTWTVINDYGATPSGTSTMQH
ncbi:molecular chaperone [Gallibacterium anatis 10672-6]|uniref:fimbrial biogenesis chaperone n=1 Tax=Gallibacterium anatis TaxID=750 RepID=UPI000532063B|nr:fimbria/pilus periplasmic chaperone [Gallibacterium anatis]KGQ47893.1 molecular chaperone [Gallibacterium anatis 10672-6]